MQPTVSDVHRPGIMGNGSKKVLRLSNKQLAEVLRRILAHLAIDDDEEAVKAYAHEHAARQLDPSEHKVVGSKEIAPGIRLLLARGSDGKSVVQSIRFDSSKFSSVQAKQWLSDHGYKVSGFEPAVEKADEISKDQNVADMLISTIHREFTVVADNLFGGGQLSQEERIALSSIIGDALDTFNQALDSKLSQLRTRDPYPPMEKSDGDVVELTAEIVAKSDEKHLAYAVVYMPDVVDTQGDRISSTEVEGMAHRWLLKSRRYDFQHERELPQDAVMPVESYIAATDFALGGRVVKQGSWVVVSYIPDNDLWQLVKTGKLNAYSIKGRGKRRPVSGP